MPLVDTKYGGVCPLGRWSIDVASPGSYDRDPVSSCIGCNFYDLDVEEFDPSVACRCPSDLTWPEYDELRKEFSDLSGKLTRKGFQEFVKDKRTKSQES